MDRTSKKSVRKCWIWAILLDQMDKTNIFITFHTTAAEYTLLSSTHRIFSRIDHMISQRKKNLSKFKKIEILPGIFLDNSMTRDQ